MLWMHECPHMTSYRHTSAVSNADGRARGVGTPEEMERGVGTICQLHGLFASSNLTGLAEVALLIGPPPFVRVMGARGRSGRDESS
jgi:hypothetical protein